jgi:glycosyltransferase involved in cell wall biosynthesis
VRVLVVTVVHRADDARILHRQIKALVDAGHEVTYAAPFTATGCTPPPAITAVDLPRATGRHRTAALRAARHLLRERGPAHDIVLLHDPELLPLSTGLRLPPVVWDVHEDTAAAISMKQWLPGFVRPAASAGVRGVERIAERRHHLILAEDAYRDRFSQDHVVVPNSTWVPEQVAAPDQPRAVYIGAITVPRGGLDLVATARALQGSGVAVHLIGHADAETTKALTQAVNDGVLTWHGFLPNDEALAFVEGSMVGLSLLHDEPNYRHSQPTKILEYFSRGVPVVTTPSPVARSLVEDAGAGLVVPFRSPKAAAEAVRTLAADADERARMGAAGHACALTDHNWAVDASRFVSALESWARH